MGQAWCKERSAKAHDSKSPLDRVFVRCAHTIYPGLKEEGSVLGATQRVTSSEIGYAGSPPRAALLRGHSIDSVDRPFHPSEWVDVNLEVPCEPRSSVILAARSQHRWSSYSPDSYDVSSRSLPGESTTPVPVPPPRRRRRRDKRLPPSKSDATENSLEADNHHSQVVSSNDELDVTIDSDDEFERIEQSLQKDSLEDIPLSESTKLEEPTSGDESPKNHTTTSLPNVDELQVNSLSSDQKSTTHEEDDEDAKRPPSHAKTASLTHDTSLNTSQVVDPEGRGSLSTAGVEDSAEANSIAADCSLSFGVHVETSTPVKRPSAEAAVDGPDHPEQPAASEASSRESADSSSTGPDEDEVVAAGVAQDVDRPADQAPAGNEDAGYESRDSATRLFSEASRSETYHDATDELSSGILEDAVTGPGDSMRFEELAIEGDSVAIQRTISEESLPREMLVDELDEDNDEQLNEEKSAKDASNHLTRQTSANGNDNFKTPPPTPELEIESAAPVEVLSNGLADKAVDKSVDKPLPSSLTELEAALSEMLDKKDEHERELDKTRLEPRIVPQLVKPGRDPDSEVELAKPVENNARIVDLYRPERLNPFNESAKNEQNSLMDEAPEKPSRLHRISLIEESIISEPLIVPTPPRRKHRTKSNLSNLNSSDEVLEAIHTYATHDRLI